MRGGSSSERVGSPEVKSNKVSFSRYLVRRISKEWNIGKRVRRQAIMHPIYTVSRTTLYNMFLILLPLIVAAIVVASPRVRHRIWFGGDLSSTGERSEQQRITSPVKPFLVVVLPDGTIVTPTVAGQV
jgi:hypothetical protein